MAVFFRPGAYQAHTDGGTTYYTMKRSLGAELSPACAVTSSHLVLGTDAARVAAVAHPPDATATTGLSFTYNHQAFLDTQQYPTLPAAPDLPPVFTTVSGTICTENGKLRT